MKLFFIWCSCPMLRNRSNHLNRSFDFSKLSWRHKLILLQPNGSFCIRLCYQKFFGFFAFHGWWVDLRGWTYHFPSSYSSECSFGDRKWASGVPLSPCLAHLTVRSCWYCVADLTPQVSDQVCSRTPLLPAAPWLIPVDEKLEYDNLHSTAGSDGQA